MVLASAAASNDCGPSHAQSGIIPIVDQGEPHEILRHAVAGPGRPCAGRAGFEWKEEQVKAAKHEAVETLRDGRPVTIRALRPEDRDGLLAAVADSSTRSLYRRFFTRKRSFSEKEVAFFLNVDFVAHLALVAVLNEGGQPVVVGGARCVVVQPGRAEVAFLVVDRYQRQGIGALLMGHLSAIARQAGIKELIAEVLAENMSMLRVFERSGLRLTTKREAGVVHVALELETM
jgi:GNAT superfamily N-acetyltransferase